MSGGPPPTLPSSLCSFNNEYQTALESISDEKILEEYEAFETLSRLARDFKSAALAYGRVIISERFLPPDEKSIKQTLVGGAVGGDKYIVAGILFKFVLDRPEHVEVAFGSDRMAAKEAGHQLKGLMKLQQCNLQGIRLPLMLVIDYRGFRLLATSMLPIDKLSLVHGTYDAGRTIRYHQEVFEKLQPALASLNLAEHRVMDGNGDEYSINGPVDMEVHESTSDGHFYALDLARLFPPEPTQAADEVPLPNGQTNVSYTVRLLRPELVQTNPEPLSSDAFSGFGRLGSDVHNARVSTAYARLLESVIPHAASYLSRCCAGAIPITALLPAGHTRLACGCVCGPDQLSRVCVDTDAHSLQVGDVGFMGSMSDDVDFTGTDATFLQAFREAYVPLPAHRSKPPVDSPGSSEEPELPVYTAIEYDTSSLIRFLHSRGINMRYCGAVYTLTTCALWKRRILMEAVARCIKAYLRHTNRHKMKQVKVASSEPYRMLLLRKLNKLFGVGFASDKAWDKHVVVRMQKQFCINFPGGPDMAGWTPLWSPQLQRTPVTLNTLASSGSSFLSFPVAFPSLDGMSMGLMSHPSQLFHQSSSDSAATASTDLPSLLGAASSRSVSGYDVYTLPDVDADMPSAKRSASAPTSSEFAQPPASLLSPPAIGTLPSMPPVDYHPMVIAPHFSSQPSRRVLSECDSPRKTARHVDYDASDMLLLLGQSKDSAVGQANLISTGARLKLDVPVVGLFLRVARLFGIQLSASCLEEIKATGDVYFRRRSPFRECDLRDLKPLVKQTPFMRYVAGTKLFIQALRETDQRDSVRLGQIAAKRFEKALALCPTDAPTLANYAFLCEAVLNRRRITQLLYYRSITANPRHVRSLYYYALFANRGKSKDSKPITEMMFRRAIDVDPNHCNTRKDYANFLANKMNKKDEAMKQLRHVLTVNPTHARACTDLGTALCKLDQPEEGLALLKRCCDAHPEDWWGGISYLKQLLWEARRDPPKFNLSELNSALVTHALSLAKLCTENAKEAYHDGELMASGRKFQSMKEAVKALVPIVEYIASGACGPGQAGVVRTLYASIAYSTNDLTLLKSAAEYFSGSGQYEHSWSIWQRVHYSQLKSESSPVAFPGGYIFNATPSSLQSHAVACFGLSRLEQGQFLLTKAIELARGDVDVIRPLMAQLASVAALDPPDSDIDPSVAPCIATTTIDSTGAASSVVASSVAEEASVVQGAPPAIPPSVEKKKPTGWGVPSGKPKPPPPPPAT